MKQKDFRMVVLVAGFVVLIGFLNYGGTILGLSDADQITLTTMLPAISLMIAAAYAVNATEGDIQGIAVAATGFCFAYLISAMNTASILIPDIGIAVGTLNISIILFFFVLGAFVGAD